MNDTLTFRLAQGQDLDRLCELEEQTFEIDRLSRRSLQRWIENDRAILLLAERGGQTIAYGLVWLLQGTRLARLYSIAVDPQQRGGGVARQLLSELERLTVEHGHLFMRLEVAAHNEAAIHLYQRTGYRVFGAYEDYYEDHSDALRMQKPIRRLEQDEIEHATPWYEQTTEFTCGPAALMMAMASLDAASPLNQATELDIWREATTIYMTAGHGGCHPVGLALAAQARGFAAEVWINRLQPLFLDGVRSPHKKAVMTTVHNRFLERAEQEGVALREQVVTQQRLQRWLETDHAVLVLISSYSFDGRKAPHWVTVTGMDEHCLYFHEPDRSDNQQAMDCQHLPIARDDFERMSVFGVSRLRTAIAIRKQG